MGGIPGSDAGLAVAAAIRMALTTAVVLRRKPFTNLIVNVRGGRID
jgi:hypothetical protein